MAGQHVVIVGAGVVGVCCAHELATRGARVTIVDRAKVCSGCSFGNSGYIAPGHGPLCVPGLARAVEHSHADPDAPFHAARPTSAALADWLARFTGACSAAHYAHCMRVLGALGRDMVASFRALIETERLDCCFHTGGSAYVAFSQSALPKTAHEGRDLREQGYPADDLDAPAMHALIPGLREDLLGGVFIREGGSLNPRRFVLELAARAQARGAEVREGRGVERVVVAGGRAQGVQLTGGERVDADAVVLTTGMQTPALLAPLGVRLPMWGVKGYHIDLAMDRIPFTLPAVIADADIILTPMDGFVRVSGMVEITEDDSLVHRRTETMLRRALDYAPSLREGREVSRWLGRRPCAPDGLPVIGPVPGVEGLLVATAHARLGLSLAPITGLLIAEGLMGVPGAHDKTPLRVDRF